MSSWVIYVYSETQFINLMPIRTDFKNNDFSWNSLNWFFIFIISSFFWNLNCQNLFVKNRRFGTSLVAWWIRLCAPNAGGLGSILGQGTRSHMHATTKRLHATTKEPTCCNWGARLLQPRSGATKKYIYNKLIN